MTNPQVAAYVEQMKIGAPPSYAWRVGVPALIEALNDTDENVRRYAAIGLGEIRETSAVLALIAALNDTSRKANWADAAAALGEIGDASAVPALIESSADESDVIRRHFADKALGKIKRKIELRDSLQHQDAQHRALAATKLAELGDVIAVPLLIERLNDRDEIVRRASAYALGELRDRSAVPALITTLKDEEPSVRGYATAALGKLRDVSAVPAIIIIMNESEGELRDVAAEVLGVIGDVSAVPALIETLRDSDKQVRASVARALERLGDSVTLPPKILADSRLSAKQRIDCLEKLRLVRYKDGPFALSYTFSDTRTLCQTIVAEQDANTCMSVQTVLNWLNGEQHLLIPSQRDTDRDSQELLRASHAGIAEAQPETLLRGSSEPEPSEEQRPSMRLRLLERWQRLSVKRNDAAS